MNEEQSEDYQLGLLEKSLKEIRLKTGQTHNPNLAYCAGCAEAFVIAGQTLAELDTLYKLKQSATDNDISHMIVEPDEKYASLKGSYPKRLKELREQLEAERELHTITIKDLILIKKDSNITDDQDVFLTRIIDRLL